MTSDFRLEDVWALPTPGDRDQFPMLVEGFVAGDPAEESHGPTRWLWNLRWKLGELFGLEADGAGLDARVESLKDRLPEDLLRAPGPEFSSLPFRSLYLLDDEFAVEIANQTVHGVLHLGWVEDRPGEWRGQMAVLVKPNGLLGQAYLAAIRPFRYTLIYPSLIRRIERDWGPSRVAR